MRKLKAKRPIYFAGQILEPGTLFNAPDRMAADFLLYGLCEEGSDDVRDDDKPGYDDTLGYDERIGGDNHPGQDERSKPKRKPRGKKEG